MKMLQTGLYLFGLMREGARVGEGLAGLDGVDPVRGLSRGGIVAAIGSVDLADFHPDSAAFEDPRRLIPLALRHEEVVETLARSGPIVPARFGVLFSSQEALETQMLLNEQAIRSFLDRAADLEEWSIAVEFDEKTLAEESTSRADFPTHVDPDPDSQGRNYFRAKKLRAEAIRIGRAKTRSALPRIVTAIGRLGEEIHVERTVGESTRNFGAACETMMKIALFIKKKDVPVLLEQVDRMAASARSFGATIRLSGPWPPYHFCPNLETAQ